MSDELPAIVSLDQFRIERTKSRYCRHNSKVIDENARRLECADCEAPLDPFDALLDLARNHQHLKYERVHAEKQIKMQTALLEDLKRQVGNVKATARRRGLRLVVPSGWELSKMVEKDGAK